MSKKKPTRKSPARQVPHHKGASVTYEAVNEARYQLNALLTGFAHWRQSLTLAQLSIEGLQERVACVPRWNESIAVVADVIGDCQRKAKSMEESGTHILTRLLRGVRCAA